MQNKEFLPMRGIKGSVLRILSTITKGILVCGDMVVSGSKLLINGSFHRDNFELLHVPRKLKMFIVEMLEEHISRAQITRRGKFIYQQDYQTVMFVEKITHYEIGRKAMEIKDHVTSYFNQISSIIETVFNKIGVISTKSQKSKYINTQQKYKKIFAQILNTPQKNMIIQNNRQIQCAVINVESIQTPYQPMENLFMEVEGIAIQEMKQQCKQGQQEKQGQYGMQQVKCEQEKRKNKKRLEKINEDFKVGGYCKVQKKLANIVYNSSANQKETLYIAVKQLKPSNKRSLKNISKIQRQLSIIKLIQNPQYLIKYYKPTDDHKKSINSENDYPTNDLNSIKIQTSYMEYIQFNLADLLTKTKYISLSYRLQLCVQVIESVIHLHQSGVVHRDIKPSNFLVKVDERGMRLKIIDFGESTRLSDIYSKDVVLGCTMPSSPLECWKNSEQGFNKVEIDYWSVGVLIYEIVFGRSAFSFSSSLNNDIKRGWMSDFSLLLDRQRKDGQLFVYNLINFICSRMIQINQKDRLTLLKAFKMLKAAQNYLQDLNTISKTSPI